MLNAFNDVTFLSEDQKSSRSGKERNRCAINEGEGIFEDFFSGSIRGILFALFLRPSIAFCFWYRLEMFSALIFLLLCFSAFCCFCAFLCFLILYFLASLLSAFFFPLLCFSFFRFSVFLASLLLCLFASLRFLLVCFSFAFFAVLFPVIRKESGYLQNLTKSSKNLPNISSTRFLSIPVWAKD